MGEASPHVLRPLHVAGAKLGTGARLRGQGEPAPRCSASIINKLFPLGTVSSAVVILFNLGDRATRRGRGEIERVGEEGYR